MSLTRCPFCPAIFTPIKTGAGKMKRTCGGRSCRSKLAMQTLDWKAITAKGLDARKQNGLARAAARIDRKFGTLTERELLIFQHGEQVGYQRGFKAGYRGRRIA